MDSWAGIALLKFVHRKDIFLSAPEENCVALFMARCPSPRQFCHSIAPDTPE
jgi:hypothetical protein